MIDLLVTIAVLSSSFIGASVAFYGLRQVRQTRSQIPSLDDFVWQEGEEWHCDERLGKLIDFFGSRMAHSLRQSMFQQMGVDQKLQKHVDQAFSLDIMDNSGIGGILDLLGMNNVKKILANNPKTLGIILQRAAPLIEQFMNKKGGMFGGQPSASSSDYGWRP